MYDKAFAVIRSDSGAHKDISKGALIEIQFPLEDKGKPSKITLLDITGLGEKRTI
jgi:cobalamin biosynthesis protein CbiD